MIMIMLMKMLMIMHMIMLMRWLLRPRLVRGCSEVVVIHDGILRKLRMTYGTEDDIWYSG